MLVFDNPYPVSTRRESPTRNEDREKIKEEAVRKILKKQEEALQRRQERSS